MKRRVVFAPEADADLDEMLTFIAAQADPNRAFGFVSRIVDYCENFVQFRNVERVATISGLACALSGSSAAWSLRFT